MTLAARPGGARDVDAFASLEGGGAEFPAELVRVMLGRADLDEATAGATPAFSKWPWRGL